MVLAALPQDTVRLIKSTQVITTPASIVKELIENALDAGATTVSVKLEKCGFLRLEVRDNGSGIHEDEVQFIAKPHFTSKISTFADLSSLTSFGFRGEALSSLCAVADVTVTSKTKESTMGHMYTFNHCGEVTSKKPAATPNGTTVVVSNLFKNVPVRHQYYSNKKHCKDELKKVEDIMLGLSFAVPNVHLTLSHDKAIVFQKNASHDLRSVLMNVFPDVGKNLASKCKDMENLTLEVFLPEKKSSGVSCYSRSSTDRLFILVNRRPINYKAVEKMIKGYYSQGSEGCHGRYPVGLINITVSPDSLDVNLEPNKNKVFLKEEDVLLEVLRAILEELYGPLEKSKNRSSNKSPESTDVSSCGDITCTFAGVSQPNVDSRSSNCSVDKKPKYLSDSTGNNDKDDDDIFQISPGAKIQTNPNSSSGKPKTNTVDVNSKKFTFQTLSAKSNQEENMCVAPKVVFGRGTDDVGKSLFSGESDEKEHIQRRSISFDDVTDGKDKRMASTPGDSDSNALPQLSLSTIHSSGNTQNPTSVPNNLNSSVGLQDSNAVSSELRINSEPTEGIMMDVNEKPSCDTGGDNIRMHESLVGEDGIPVFKIAPLMSPCFEGTIVTEEPRASSNKENILEVTHSVPKPTDVENKSSKNEKILHCHENYNSNAENPQAAIGKQGTWSRGNIVENGDNIQTIQLLKPQNGTLACTSKNLIKGNEGKRHLSPSESRDSSGIPPKKTKLNSLGPASFDYVHSKPVKRPSSAFILYSRDIRLEVLSQHPGKDFAWVAKEMADRWKSLDLETKKHYQDMAKEDSERYQREVKKIRELRGLNTSLNSTLDKGMGGRTTLDRYVAPLTPQLIKKEGKIVQQQHFVSKTPWKEWSKDWIVTTDIIRDKIQKRHKLVSRDNDIHLIGPLGTCGGWTCLIGGVVNAFNTSRLHETILCHNLYQSFKLPASDLKDPVPFNASVIGESNWALLIKLKCEKIDNRNMYTVTDRRITMNGFKITLYQSSGNPALLSHGEITGLSNSIGFYGISDFKEILSVLVANPFATVSQTRPLKLQFWLKGESVRMVRSGSNIQSQESVLEKLNAWREIQNCSGANDVMWEKAKCIHDKLIFIPLYSLDDLPLSQSQTQNTQDN